MSTAAEYFGKDVGSGRVLIHQKIGQSDLAAMTGVVHETVNRILNDWKSRKVVSRLTGYYCLENKAILQKEADTLDGAASLSPELDDLTFAIFQQTKRPLFAS